MMSIGVLFDITVYESDETILPFTMQLGLITMSDAPGFSISLLARCVLLLLVLSACSHPQLQTQAEGKTVDPGLGSGSVVMPDGYVLPIKTWQPADEPSAVVLGIHGFNDYSNAFDTVGPAFAQDSIITYAIDQRGFGATDQRGIWAGHDTMQSDLLATVNLLCEKHAGLPVFVLGESMGGAVVISASQQLVDTCVSGVMLSAPAVWGWQAMPWWQTLPLRLLAHTVPELTLTGEDLDIDPSDNYEMLRALGRDPLIIKETRVDAIYGLTDLMELALNNGGSISLPTLILYGEHDEIITPEPFCTWLNSLPNKYESRWRLVLYADGYHMLSRDLQGDVVIRDMRAWLRDQNAPLPSGEEIIEDASRLSMLDGCKRLGEFRRALKPVEP